MALHSKMLSQHLPLQRNAVLCARLGCSCQPCAHCACISRAKCGWMALLCTCGHVQRLYCVHKRGAIRNDSCSASAVCAYHASVAAWHCCARVVMCSCRTAFTSVASLGMIVAVQAPCVRIMQVWLRGTAVHVWSCAAAVLRPHAWCHDARCLQCKRRVRVSCQVWLGGAATHACAALLQHFGGNERVTVCRRLFKAAPAANCML
jgi:hypothetical protein